MVMIARIFGLSLITWLVAILFIFILRKLIIVRILSVSLLTGLAVIGFLLALIKPNSQSLEIFPIIFFGAVGMIVGAIAGATREIVAAQTQKPVINVDLEF